MLFVCCSYRLGYQSSSIVPFYNAGARFLACGSVASSVYECAAVKRMIMVVEITKLKAHYMKLKVQ